MPELTRSMDEIIAAARQHEHAQTARLRGIRALLGLSALAFAALLLAEQYAPGAALWVSDLRFAGPPLRVLLVVGVVVEGAGAAFLLQRHEERAYPLHVQGSATSVASAGGLLFGAGAAVLIVYGFLLAQYFGGFGWLFEFSTVLVLAGVGVFLAALPPAACSVLRFGVDEAP